MAALPEVLRVEAAKQMRLGAPPQLATDNVFCTRLSLASGARSDDCRPPAEHTAGAYALDALPLADEELTAVVWRAAQVHVSARAARGFRERIDLPLGPLAGAERHGGSVALLARPVDAAGAQGSWRLVLAAPGALQIADLERAGSVIPGLALDAARGAAVVCVPTEDNRLELRSFALPSLTPLATVEVRRLSRAAVFDCQLAVSPTDGRVGVAWREAGIVQAFAAIVPPL